MTNPLVGKWIQLNGEDYWKSGHVTDYLGEGIYLVRMDSHKKTTNPIKNLSEAINLQQYLTAAIADFPWMGVNVFDTEEELRTYIEWVNDTEDNKKEESDNVMTFKPKKKD